MSNTPLWDVIARDLAEQITSGSLKVGDRLQSEAELAQRYGVSRMTVCQALARLQAEGLVRRRHGAGTFVASQTAVHRAGNRLGSLHEELGLTAEEVETRVRQVEVQVPPNEISQVLEMSRSQTAVRIERLRILDGDPISFQEAWVPVLLEPRLAREPLVDGSICETLGHRAGIEVVRASQEVSASLASARETGALDIDVKCALIYIRRTSSSQHDLAVVASRSCTLPQFSLTYELERFPRSGDRDERI